MRNFGVIGDYVVEWWRLQAMSDRRTFPDAYACNADLLFRVCRRLSPKRL